MSTYLLTWNPWQWNWKAGEYEALVRTTSPSRPTMVRWSCGNRGRIEKGDRVFLLRQGSESPGMISAGVVTRRPYLAPMWDRSRGRRRLALYIGVAWERFLPLNGVLKRETLLKGVLPRALVNARASGYQIPADVALRLEQAWAKHTSQPLAVAAMTGMSAMEGQLVHGETFRRARDRALRNEALGRSGGVCEVCRRDFSTLLGGLGLRALQVHHRRQLSQRDGPRVTRIEDLAVVCANCHCLLHTNPHRPMSVAQLRIKLGTGTRRAAKGV